MNTTWYESHRVACEPYLEKHLSLEAAWRQCQDASWLMWLVSELPTLSIRCRWVAAELARQFALLAIGAAGVTGPAVETLRACAPVVDKHTASAAFYAAHAAAIAADADAAADTVYVAYTAAHAAVDSDSDCAGGTAVYSAEVADCASDTAGYAEAAGVPAEALAALVRAAIPWAWVRDAASVDAPELLEVASP